VKYKYRTRIDSDSPLVACTAVGIVCLLALCGIGCFYIIGIAAIKWAWNQLTPLWGGTPLTTTQAAAVLILLLIFSVFFGGRAVTSHKRGEQ